MSIIIYSALMGLSAGYAVYGYWRKGQVEPEYFETRRRHFPVEKERNLIEKRRASYEELQKRYKEEHQQLRQMEEIVQHHHIGVGTFDPVLYKRNKDINDLEVLDGELQSVSRQIAEFKEKGQAIIRDPELATDMQAHHMALRQRCFDAEAEAALAEVTWYNVHRLSQRLRHCCKDIDAQGRSLGIAINPDYRDLRIHQLRLVYEIKQLYADIQALEEEKQQAATPDASDLHEAVEHAQQEAEERLASLEEALFQLNKESPGHEKQREELLHLLGIIKTRQHFIGTLQENPRAGFVYVASNDGVFTQKLIKVGVTRHPDPERHIKHMGGQALPAYFEVHGVFFSNNAQELLSALHQRIGYQQVNLTDSQRGFYKLPPEEALRHIEEIQREHRSINVNAV